MADGGWQIVPNRGQRALTAMDARRRLPSGDTYQSLCRRFPSYFLASSTISKSASATSSFFSAAGAAASGAASGAGADWAA